MTAPELRSLPAAGEPVSRPRRVRAFERARVLAWLDEGLRRGERGRLAAEYPLSLSARDLGGHRVVFAGSRPLAHALLHAVVLRSGEQRLRAGLIGCVYTAPEARGRGLAQACIQACLDAARAQRCDVALLWSDLAGYYERLGFRPAGHERRIALTPECAQRAAGAATETLSVGPPEARDFAQLERVYDAKPAGVVRGAGALARLARAPETLLLVARRAGVPIAYAACGRGDDLRGVVHEWAGEADGVLACFAQHALRGAVLVLASAHAEEAVERLVAAGAPVEHTALALARRLDGAPPDAPALADWAYLWGFDSI
jgi:predicted N-acetyltransferase YhbS